MVIGTEAARKKRNFFRLSTEEKASVLYIITGILSRGVSFLFTPIYTRLLSESEYGVYSLYVSWLGLFTVL